MKMVWGFVLVATLGFAATADAQVSTTSPHQIGFYCPPYAESFVEGGYYQFPTTTQGCTWQTGSLPTNPHYGGFFRGTVGNSVGSGNFMNLSTESALTRFPIVPDPIQGEPFFAAIWEVRNGPAFQFDLPLFLNFFQNGSNPPPSTGWGVINWKWGEPPEDSLDPVIIIPGILGSQQHNGEWVIDPILHTYDDLIATLDANAYILGFDLFTFPYDWRKSNVETAVLLKQKINEIKNLCACEKIDLVAHSMGGLVARQYIQSDAYEGDVDQLIFLGTPHLGAPKAYLMWEGGELDPIGGGLSDSVLQLMLDQEATEKGYSDLFAYAQSEPIESVRELLPVYDYIFDAGVLRQYPNSYPANTFLVNLNDDISQLFDSGVTLSNFVGDISSPDTITGLSVIGTNEHLPKWAHGYPIGFYEKAGNLGLERGFGDSTVPLPSASLIQSNLTTFEAEHNSLPGRAKADVYEILTGVTAVTLIDEINFPNIPLIIVKILSPADLFIIAPDGKKIGKESGQEVNEIQNAFYTGFNTDTEFITILNPLDGEYKIYTEGTADGSYTVETAYISEELTIEASFTGNTTPGKITELVTIVDNDNPEELEILPTALSELIALLKQKVQGLDIKDKLKKNLLKKIERLEKKVEKSKQKGATKTVLNLSKKVMKKYERGKIDDADAQELLSLLEELENTL